MTFHVTIAITFAVTFTIIFAIVIIIATTSRCHCDHIATTTTTTKTPHGDRCSLLEGNSCSWRFQRHKNTEQCYAEGGGMAIRTLGSGVGFWAAFYIFVVIFMFY
jgi:hypothetical protein